MTNPPFSGNVRILPSDIGPAIPVVDIAENIGYTRSALTHAINRHTTLFNGFKTFKGLDTRRGNQQGVCLNNIGVGRLLMVLSPSKINKAELKERLDAFRLKEFGKIESDESVALVPMEQLPCGEDHDPLKESLNRNADIAEILISRYEYDPVVARRIAIQNVINEIGDAALPWKGPAMLPAATEPETPPAVSLPPEADPDFDRYFSLKKISNIVHEPEDRVRNILEKEGLLSYAHGIWHLTMLGQKFGKVFITYPQWPHRTYEQKNIRWSPAAIERVKVHLAAGQQQLAAVSLGG